LLPDELATLDYDDYYQARLTDVLAKLPRGHRLRTLVDDMLDGRTAEGLRELLTSAPSIPLKTDKATEACILLLGVLPYNRYAVEDIATRLGAHMTTASSADARAPDRWFWSGVGCGLVAALIQTAIERSTHDLGFGVYFVYLWALWTLGFKLAIFPFWLRYEQREWQRIRIAMALCLGRLRSPLSIEPLAIVSQSKPGILTSVARRALRETLNANSPCLDEKVTPSALRKLAQLLRIADEPLTPAILHWLEALDDGSCLATVEAFAALPAANGLQSRAYDVAGVLRARVVDRENRGSLLRAAGTGGESPDVLMRPC
jgi:hypothetical protein